MARNVLFVFNQFIPKCLLDVGCVGSEAGYAVNDIRDQMKPVQIVHHRHIKGRGGRPLLLVATHVQIRMVRAAIGQAMDQQRIAVEGKNNRRVFCEKERYA